MHRRCSNLWREVESDRRLLLMFLEHRSAAMRAMLGGISVAKRYRARVDELWIG